MNMQYNQMKLSNTMKNFGLFSLIIFLTIPVKADTIESGYGRIAEAWIKQTGLEIELSNSGNYLYRKINEEYRTPLTVAVQLTDAVINGKIQLNYKMEF